MDIYKIIIITQITTFSIIGEYKLIYKYELLIYICYFDQNYNMETSSADKATINNNDKAIIPNNDKIIISNNDKMIEL